MENYLTEENATLALDNLLYAAQELGVEDIAKEVLFDERFFNCSGASEKGSHHYGKHGLVTHVHEVMVNGFALVLCNQGFYNFSFLDKQEFLLSVVFHDYGKIFDYEALNKEMSEWGPTRHKRVIHHISRSALFFSEMAKKHNLDVDLTDKVLHNILSHHGCREWGSPVSPATRIAWLLHLSDMVSARLYDCVTKDSFK